MKAERNAVVIHGGGPTSVLNASLAGVIETCRATPGINRLYGARFGVQGLADGDWVDLSSISSDCLAGIRKAPGSALGSSRRKLDEQSFGPLLDLLKERGVNYLFFTGGNGSMLTAQAIQEFSISRGREVCVIGIPKTVDNDLCVTDHTPGFGSAARFYAHAVRDIGLDNLALPSPVTIVEVIGRNAGWVTGAAALARGYPDDAPHLIYLPERPPTLDQICADIDRVFRRIGRAVVAVCEGLRDPEGNPFGASLDRAGSKQHELARNLGHSLAQAVQAQTGLRVRSEKPGLLGRSCSLAVSDTDAAESYLCGCEAVKAALQGRAGVMVAMRRTQEKLYRIETFLADLSLVAGIERLVPAEWIGPLGNDITSDFLDYVRPLAGEIPRHDRLG